jgi:hypothetical protein
MDSSRHEFYKRYAPGVAYVAVEAEDGSQGIGSAFPSWRRSIRDGEACMNHGRKKLLLRYASLSFLHDPLPAWVLPSANVVDQGVADVNGLFACDVNGRLVDAAGWSRLHLSY